MSRHLPLLLAAFVLLGLGLHAFVQDRRIAALRSDLERLRAVTEEAQNAPAAPWAAARERPADGAQPRPLAGSERSQPPPAASARGPEPARIAPAEPRVPVSHDEIARVESAVLSLLEADRPELREKLRAVVQEQQETIEHEQQEQRRERWIARTEARLAEVSAEVALNDAQKHELVQLMLANRDQIGDLMRSAESSKDYASARQTIRGLRQETDAKVRELLSPPQYEAYKRVFDDDDDERRPRGPR